MVRQQRKLLSDIWYRQRSAVISVHLEHESPRKDTEQLMSAQRHSNCKYGGIQMVSLRFWCSAYSHSDYLIPFEKYRYFTVGKIVSNGVAGFVHRTDQLVSNGLDACTNPWHFS